MSCPKVLSRTKQTGLTLCLLSKTSILFKVLTCPTGTIEEYSMIVVYTRLNTSNKILNSLVFIKIWLRITKGYLKQCLPSYAFKQVINPEYWLCTCILVLVQGLAVPWSWWIIAMQYPAPYRSLKLTGSGICVAAGVWTRDLLRKSMSELTCINPKYLSSS